MFHFQFQILLSGLSNFSKSLKISSNIQNIFDISIMKHDEYCKTLIIRVTLFSRGNRPWYIHEILFSRIFMSSSITLTLEIISEDFIFASVWSREFTRK